jgi:hypothetical protein
MPCVRGEAFKFSHYVPGVVCNYPGPFVNSLHQGPSLLRAILQYFIGGFQELQPSRMQRALKMKENRPNLAVPDRAAQRLSKTLEGNFPVR